MIKPEQLAAARSLATWSRKDLAKETGLAPETIKNIELGKSQPERRTVSAIKLAFDRVGIEFTPNGGVDRKEYTIDIIRKPEAYLTFLERIYTEDRHEGGEILFKNAINRRSPPAIIDVQLRLRALGFKMRFLVEEGDTELHFPLNEYRYVPKKNFVPILHTVYRDRFAIMIYERNEPDVVIIRNTLVADSLRASFNAEWELYNQPTETTAKEVYE